MSAGKNPGCRWNEYFPDISGLQGVTLAGRRFTSVFLDPKLLQRVHQPRDRPVQFFIRSPQLLDLVDRVQHRGVVFASELPADLSGLSVALITGG
jgi:hypothetical protein